MKLSEAIGDRAINAFDLWRGSVFIEPFDFPVDDKIWVDVAGAFIEQVEAMNFIPAKLIHVVLPRNFCSSSGLFPFTRNARRIARFFEEISEGDLRFMQSLCADEITMVVHSGHQGDSGGLADRVGECVARQDPFSQSVDLRRGDRNRIEEALSGVQFHCAIGRDAVVRKIIDQDKDDIGSFISSIYGVTRDEQAYSK